MIYVATAPKSNAAYVAYGAAKRAAKESGSLLPPKHILNAPTKLMKSEGYGRGYAYDHDQEEAFSGQDYFPEELGRQTVLRSAGARLRARNQEAPGVLGEASQGQGRSIDAARSGLAPARSARWEPSGLRRVSFSSAAGRSTPKSAPVGGDTPRTAALVATDTSLSWFEGYCRIGKMYKAKAVYVQAHCGGKDVPVTLDAQGDRHAQVTWSRAKAEELQRCK